MKIKLFALVSAVLLFVGVGASADVLGSAVAESGATVYSANAGLNTIYEYRASADGKKIVYLATQTYKNSNDQYAIYVYDIETATETLVVAETMNVIFDNPLKSGDKYWQDIWRGLEVNADASKIAYSAYPYKFVILDNGRTTESIWSKATLNIVDVATKAVTPMVTPHQVNAVGVGIRFIDGDISKALVTESTVPKKDMGKMYTSGFGSYVYSVSLTAVKLKFKTASANFKKGTASDDGKFVARCKDTTSRGVASAKVEIITVKTSKSKLTVKMPGHGWACSVKQVLNDGKTVVVETNEGSFIYVDGVFKNFANLTQVNIVGDKAFYATDSLTSGYPMAWKIFIKSVPKSLFGLQ